MPDQWERYGKRYYAEGWESGPSRRQQRDAAAHDDPVHDRTPGKKNKDACKANHWGPHVPSYTVRDFPWYARNLTGCGWVVSYSRGQYVPRWWCGHTGHCILCGKRYLKKPQVCPSRTRDDIEPPPWVIEQAREETQAYQARRIRYGTRRIIKGPSHYRKPKANP